MFRAILIGPVACTLIGGLAGICLGMLFRQEPNERAHVHLEDSVPFLLGGAVAGCLAGVYVFTACTRWPRAQPLMNILVMTVLGAAISAPIGWMIGDQGMERLARKGMAVGAAIGMGGGLSFGILQSLTDRRRRLNEQDVTSDRPSES